MPYLSLGEIWLHEVPPALISLFVSDLNGCSFQFSIYEGFFYKENGLIESLKFK